jgi:hypothetical protein
MELLLSKKAYLPSLTIVTIVEEGNTDESQSTMSHYSESVRDAFLTAGIVLKPVWIDLNEILFLR